MKEQRVVITGMGIYSCIGLNLAEVKDALFAGRSGIQFDEKRKEFGYRSCLTGMVPMPDLKGDLSRRQRVSLGEEAAYAYVATKEALQNANIDQAYLDANEVGVIYGNDSTAKSVIESVDKIREKKDTTEIFVHYIEVHIKINGCRNEKLNNSIHGHVRNHISDTMPGGRWMPCCFQRMLRFE